MRKVFWSITAAGVLTAGVLLSASYYACGHPETTIGRCITTAANASIAMQPVTSLVSTVEKAAHHVIWPNETAPATVCADECIPADPQPIDPDAEPALKLVDAGTIDLLEHEAEHGPAPIIINEDEPIQHVEEAEAPPSTIEFNGTQGADAPESACPMVMPYCTDDEPMPTPSMPYADGETKQPDGSATSDEDSFKAWKNLYEEPSPKNKTDSAEELPAPKEDIESEPKCQEDIHQHEHYSGCPHMTCPYTGKTYPSYAPATKSGKEEISEEPEMHPKKHSPKSHSGKKKEKCPPTEGVDTMEYRSSDGGLNEFGPGPF